VGSRSKSGNGSENECGSVRRKATLQHARAITSMAHAVASALTRSRLAARMAALLVSFVRAMLQAP
jgi:hypothetical protein